MTPHFLSYAQGYQISLLLFLLIKFENLADFPMDRLAKVGWLARLLSVVRSDRLAKVGWLAECV